MTAAAPLGAALAQLLGELELAADDLGALQLCGDDPHYPSPWRLAGAMAVAQLAAAAAMAAVGRRRGLPAQDLTLAVATAARHIFPEHNHAPRLGGRPYPKLAPPAASLLRDVLPTADGGYFVASALQPAARQRWAEALGCAATRGGFAAALAARPGAALEALAAQHRLAGAACRTPAAWRRHPHGAYLAALPLVRQAGHAVGRPFPALPALSAVPARPDAWRARASRRPGELGQAGPGAGARPLAGIRVLVLGRVFAGPLVGRTLAEQGAQVLHVGQAGAPEPDAVYLEGYVGGRSLLADLRVPAQRAAVRRLAAQADVVVDNHRLGALARYDLDAAAVGRDNPDAVHLRLSAFGDDGPWGGRPGYDMTVAAATGLMQPEAGRVPQFLPSLLLCDFVTAALGAAAVAAALAARQRGAYPRRLSLSLARTASWCMALGRLPPGTLPQPRGRVRQADYVTPLGTLRRLPPAVSYRLTPAYWAEPVLYVQGSVAWHEANFS